MIEGVPYQHPRPALTVRSGYRLWRRLLDAGGHLRRRRCERCPPSPCDDARPIAQVRDHLLAACGPQGCLLAAFQLTFQSSALS